jgi:hypothetical protein
VDEVVEIHLPMSQKEAPSYFALEEAVTEAIESSDLGYVDGNDVGQGEFTIFLTGADGRKLLDAVRPLLAEGLLNPGAHAVIRRQSNDEVTEDKVILVPSNRDEPLAAKERQKEWSAVGFGAIQGGDEGDAFWQALRMIWVALPTSQPSKPNAAQLVVVWQVAGRWWSKVDERIKVNIENRDKRMVGATVPVRAYPPAVDECQRQIRESLAEVLEMCRSLIGRKRLDWDITDVEQVIKRIAQAGSGNPGAMSSSA